MKRNELLTSIFDSFDDCANEFCKNSNALICEISAKYGAEDEAEDLKYRYAEVFFKNFKIVFKYSARGLLGTMNSILECMVFLDKSRDAVAIPLPIMADFCGVAAAPLVIPLILNENNMRQAFDCIISALNKMLPRIEETANDYTLKEAALAYYSSELKTVYGSGMEELLVGKTGYKTEDSYRIITNRLLSTAFLRFMKGDTKGAAKKLEKAKYDLFGYEKRMLGLWSSSEKTDMPDISSIRENLRKYNGSGVEKVDMREFWSCFISWFVIGAGAAIVYCALFLLVSAIVKRGAVFTIEPRNLPYCFLFAFLTGVCGSYFFRFKIYKLLFKNRYEEYEQFSLIANGKGVDRFMRAFFGAVVTVCVIGCVLFAKQNITFSKDGFTDNTKLLKLSGDFYGYDEIERVYYKPDRVNDYGDMLDYPSYVIELKNGKQIDLYEMAEIENYETELTKLLNGKGVRMEKQE